ncbi:carbohydrate ABC transporter permease [Actinospica robiniae]|uniref:carbohydrate ABC transporter permease n=1 Tax=Actinospica robiniae TaxID=304901 RepID=UPI00040D943B|nr:carbohydrate ABC transporter permease [Actinospica robiniae]
MSSTAFTPTRRSEYEPEPDPRLTAVRPTSARATRKKVVKWVLNTVAVVISVVWIFPIYWMLIVAVTPLGQVYSIHPQLIPGNISLEAFRAVLTDSSFYQSLRNSLIVTFSTVVVATLVGFLAATAIARFRFRFRNSAIVLVMIVQMVPLIALIAPLVYVYTKIGLSESLFGLVIGLLALTLPFCIWTLRGFVAGIPAELEEAAMVDGCTRVGAFFRIILPLVVPGLVSTAIYTLIQTWTEFQLTNFMISGANHYTLPLYLNAFLGTNQEVLYNEVMATALLMAVPIVALFLLVQRQVASGLTAGAVKG